MHLPQTLCMSVPCSDFVPCFGSSLDHGWLHKAVILPEGIHLIEEMQVFDQGQAVKSLVLSPQKVRKDFVPEGS